LGQNLFTSTYIGEINFAVMIAILGLVLFALLIGNMQVNLVAGKGPPGQKSCLE
jgi:cyclic nucleotide gated channel